METKINIVAGTADANEHVRARLAAPWAAGTSYLTAITDEIEISARCIAREAVRGLPHYQSWLDEHAALCLMRDRVLLLGGAGPGYAVRPGVLG